MKVLNVHERDLRGEADVGALIDDLAGGDSDRLWPWERWPAMRFDRRLGVGAVGGHGPIRYEISEYEPGRRVRFQFTRPRGFIGFHEYRVLEMSERKILQHVLTMRVVGLARVTWPLVFEPLHNALIEDSLDKAERAVTGEVQHPARWSPHVRTLRWFFRRGQRAGGRAVAPLGPSRDHQIR